MRNEGLNRLVRIDLDESSGLEHRHCRRGHPLGDSRRRSEIQDIGLAPFLNEGGQRVRNLVELRRAGSALTQQKFMNAAVDRVVKQNTVRAFSVATDTAGFLHILLDRSRRLKMNDVAEVTLVDSEAEGACGNHHVASTIVHELLLLLSTLTSVHPAVITIRRNLHLQQSTVHSVHIPSRRAVHDPRPTKPDDEATQRTQTCVTSALDHFEAEVCTMGGGNLLQRLSQIKDPLEILTDRLRCRRR